MKRMLLLCCLPLTAAAFERDWLQCRAVGDNTARLACYDALADQAAIRVNADVAGKTENAAAQAVVPSEAPASTTVTVADQAAVAATAPVKQQTSAEFGLEKQAQQAQLEEIRSRIVGSFRGWEPKGKITLENGQVWQIADGSRAYYAEQQSPEVVIERGVFGSFFLKVDGVNRSPKIKRLK